MQIPASILGQQPFFKGLSGQQLDLLYSYSMPVQFPAGKIIFREGQLANRFYLILEGKVALESSMREKGGKPRLVQTLGAGNVLGWSWLFSPYFWHFDARAVKATNAIFIYGTPIRELCETDHDLGYELMKRAAEIVIGRLQAARRRLL
jgi:CRP/FNR family cyclic AMP-dependent transcriptional regulator